jgi:hypothetical protein
MVDSNSMLMQNNIFIMNVQIMSLPNKDLFQ